MAEVSVEKSVVPAEFHQGQTNSDRVPFNSVCVPVQESNALLRALTGKAERQSYSHSLHDAEHRHGRTAVSRSVILVDASTTKENDLVYLKVNAVLGIDRKLTFIKIVPHIFGQLPKVTIPFDKMTGICAGEDGLSDPLCICLDQSEIMKAVFIQYASESCNVSKSACFLLESGRGRRAFVGALMSIWQEKRHCFAQTHSPSQ